MFQQINTQVLALSKNFADTAFKAQSLALEGFEKIAGLQLKTLENQVNATTAFLSEAFKARDFETAKTVWPKGVNLVKESTEKLYSTSQEVFGVGLKTSEALGQLARDAFETTNDKFTKSVNAVNAAAASVTAKASK